MSKSKLCSLNNSLIRIAEKLRGIEKEQSSTLIGLQNEFKMLKLKVSKIEPKIYKKVLEKVDLKTDKSDKINI